MSGFTSHAGSRCPYALLAALLAVWFTNSFNAFRCADESLYDLFETYEVRSPQQADVLLVYANEGVLESESRLASLVESIGELEPSQIAVIHPMTDRQYAKLKSLSCAERVFVGASIPKEPHSKFVLRPHEYIAELDIDRQPILRHHTSSHLINDTQYQGLDSELAIARGSNMPTDGEFTIRFRGGADSLPHVGQRVFEDGSIVSELVAGRIVLVGPSDGRLPDVITPSTAGSSRMSQLEVHGHIVQTLIDGQAMLSSSALANLALLLVLSTVAYNLLRQSPGRRLPQIAVVLLVLVVLTFPAIAYYASLRLPLTSCLVALCIVWLTVWHQRFVTLTDLVGDWMVSRQADFQPVTPQSYVDAWSSVGKTTKRLFRCERVAVLELPDNETHLKIVSTVGCEPTEIEERRRDVLRSPYRDAIEQRCPLHLTDRRFFSEEIGERSEFVAPLHVGSKLVGVLVLEIDTELVSDGKFDESLTEFVDEMAEYLLDARKRNQQLQDKDKITNKLRLTPEEVIADSVHDDEASQRSYAEMLVNTLETTEVMMAVYDGFGSFVRANQKMLDRLLQLEIAVADTDLASVVSKLSSWSIDDCQEAFRRCVADRQSTEIALLPTESSRVTSLLHIKPLKRSDSANEGWESAYVSLQIVDGTTFTNIALWQSQFARDQSDRLAHYLSKLNRLTAELSPSEDPEESILRQVNELISTCQTELVAKLSDQIDNCFVLNAREILMKAIVDASENVDSEMVDLKLNVSDNDDAFANPFLLQTCFSTVLDGLTVGMPRKGKVDVETATHGGTLSIHFKTQCEDRRKKRRDQAANYLTQVYEQRFAEIKQWLNEWGGDIAVTCGANYRVEVQIQLRCKAPELMELADG